MIEFLQYMKEHLLEIEQIHDHAGSRINFARDRHIQQVVVAVPRLVVAGAEGLAVLPLIPLWLLVAVGGREFDAFGQKNGRHNLLEVLSYELGVLSCEFWVMSCQF